MASTYLIVSIEVALPRPCLPLPYWFKMVILTGLIGLARVVGSAQDALSDDIVSRLAIIVGDGLSLLDKVNRSGLDRLLENLEQENIVVNLFDALNRAAEDTQTAGHSGGGLGGLWKIAKDPDTQDVVHFFVAFGKHFRDCRLAQKGD